MVADISSLLEPDTELDALQQQFEQQVTDELIDGDVASPGLMTYDLETIPDESRFPIPQSATPPGLKASAADVLKEAIPEIKKRLDDATDEELVSLLQTEQSGEKPRKGVTDAIADMRKARETEFDKWLKAHSVDPFTCRICCMGWAIGARDPRAVTAITDDEERALLTAFWRLNNAERIRVGFGITRFDDLVVLNRSVALGIDIPRRLNVSKYSNREAHDLENIIFRNSQVQKCKTVARAWGICIPCPDVDGSQVYQLVKAGNFARVAEYCRSDVVVERAMFEIASRMFA